MRNIQLFFLALIPGFLFSQNYIKYHNLVNEAEFDMDNSRWESAKHKLIEAFKIADPLPVDLFMLPKCYCVLGEKKKAEKHLIKAASRSLNLPIERWARYDSIFYRKCFNNEEFISLRNKMDSINSVLIGKWESSEKIKAVRDTFKNFFNIDQQYRSQLTDQHCRDRTDISPECLEFRNQWMLSDSLLQINVYNYISKHGFPVEVDEDIYILLSHFNRTNYQKMKPILYRELQKGKVEPFFYGMILDRLEYLYNANTCTYFVFSQDCGDEKWATINKYRLEAGMSIYYNGPRRGGYGRKTALPWLNRTKN